MPRLCRCADTSRRRGAQRPASTESRSCPFACSPAPLGRGKCSARCVPADIWGRGYRPCCLCRNSCLRYLPTKFHPGAAPGAPRGIPLSAAKCIPPAWLPARSVRPCRNPAARSRAARSRSNERCFPAGLSAYSDCRRRGWYQAPSSYAVHLARLGGHDAVKLGVPWELICKGQDHIFKEQQSFAGGRVGNEL